MKKITILFLLLGTTILFCIEKMQLSIRYLGIPVVDVSMETSSDRLVVQAESTALASLAADMNNSYIINYEDNFLPKSYKKIIKQKDYRENRITSYNRKDQTANRVSFIDSTLSVHYPILPDTRDFFSALSYLRYVQQESGTITLDANKLLWSAKFRLLKNETLKTNIGKIKCDKYLVEFTKLTDAKRERSDMLTNNLVDEEKQLYLWLTKDNKRIPVKVKFQMSPFSVYWHLTEYENL